MTNNKIVLTLDAGGTNFVFSAIQDFKELVEPITKPANAHNLELCLQTIIQGFEEVKNLITEEIYAISFAFPGPADYDKGIIGDLPNFKAFKNGIALGPMLKEHFNLPVFINNDGNLYAYGEALSGYLPYLNSKIEKAGGMKRFKNLIGITLGTGFGCGIVLDNYLISGDNSCGAEIHNTLNKFNPNWNGEESVSTRAIQRVYSEEANLEFNDNLMPKDIYEIAKGIQTGNQEAAVESYRKYGESLGSSIANVVTLIDGFVVLGGGITAAWELFSPALFKELDRIYVSLNNSQASRLSFKMYNLEDETIFNEFAKGNNKELSIPGSDKTIWYDDMARTGVGISKIGGSTATALGAYAYALNQ